MNGTQQTPADPNSSTNGRSATGTGPAKAASPELGKDLETSLNQSQGIIDDEADIEAAQFDASVQPFASLYAEDYDTTEYGLLPPENAVIIRPYGGEDDDILLQELRPRFVVMYEPNLPFIRRLEVYKNCNPGLALRVYQMTYTNSFEEDRFLASMQREAEAFKKLIEDRSVRPDRDGRQMADGREWSFRYTITTLVHQCGIMCSGPRRLTRRVMPEERKMPSLQRCVPKRCLGGGQAELMLDTGGYSRDGRDLAIAHRRCWDQGHSTYAYRRRLHLVAQDVCRAKGFAGSGVQFGQRAAVGVYTRRWG